MRRRNIYEQQTANRRATALVMAAFTVMVGMLGIGVDVFFLGWTPGGSAGFPFPLATFGALLFGSASAFSGLNAGSRSVLASTGAVPVRDNDPRHQQLLNVVEEMSIAAGLPRPSVYVVPDPDPNAFATGKDPHHASVAVTEGLLSTLSREELQGVVAHEMSHIRNMDIRLMTVVAALIGAVMLVTEFGLRSARLPGGKRGSKGAGGLGGLFFLLWLVAMLLAPLVSRLLAMAVSRQREYLADASAAELTRNPLALASALERIHAATGPTKSIKRGTAHLCIDDPLERPVNEREGWFAELLATHPPIRNRIAALRVMGYRPPDNPSSPPAGRLTAEAAQPQGS
jgi:heat shock protein HtpX